MRSFCEIPAPVPSALVGLINSHAHSFAHSSHKAVVARSPVVAEEAAAAAAASPAIHEVATTIHGGCRRLPRNPLPPEVGELNTDHTTAHAANAAPTVTWV